MKNKICRMLATVVVACGGVAVSGCMTVATYDQESRMPTSFASGPAAQTFYDTVFVPEPKHRGAVSLSLPIQIRRNVRTEAGRFNEAVRATDSNANGTITLSEAQIYREQVEGRRGEAAE